MRLKISTYNLRMSYLDTDKDNDWSVRRERLMQSLCDLDFDILGVQEVDSLMQQQIRETFGEVYEMRFFSPYASDGIGNKSHGILVRKQQYEMKDFRYFWMGPEWQTQSKSDCGTHGPYCRGGCCAVVVEKASGARVFLMCTHACYNFEPNALYAPIYLNVEKAYNVTCLPSFFIGDMNATPEKPASLLFRTYWQDAYLALDKNQRRGGDFTFTGYQSPEGSTRIDYVYFRGDGVRPTAYACGNKLYNGKFASDHYPVTVWFEVDELKSKNTI